MAQNISPGVYTKIIDLSQYLADIPGTFGFCPILTKRGPDNQLTFIGNGRDYRNLFGSPDIAIMGKHYGQGPYIVENHLSIATSCYVTRALPEDATYSNLFLGMQLVDPNEGSSSNSLGGGLSADPVKAELATYSHSGINSVPELDTFLDQADITTWINTTDTGGIGLSDGWLAYFRPIGRGDSYDDFAIIIEKHVNPQKTGVYVLEIYETQFDGDDVLTESYEVSFNPLDKDSAGESLYIEDVVNRFSDQIRVKINPKALEVLEEQRVEFHKNEEEDTYPDNPYYIDDPTDPNYGVLGYKEWIKQETQTVFDAAQADLETALDELVAARELTQLTAAEVVIRNTAIDLASTSVALARTALATASTDLEDAFQLDILTTKDYDTTTATIEPIHMDYGSDGSLFAIDPRSGNQVIHQATADMILAQAYVGILTDPLTLDPMDKILDTEEIWIDLVYDPGYPTNVKYSAENISKDLRRDCITITDNGDNNNFKQAKDEHDQYHLTNSRYVSRYEGYSTIFDVWTGKDIAVSPVYHMSKIIPMVDKEYELWYAPAGFNRATISDIKTLRWSPKLGERDQLYLMQLNPIVRFNVGYTVWGQLTTQVRPSALQDLNVMRLVLYIKRALEQYLKFFIFEFNDDQTWAQIKNGIIPFLETIRRKRGLKSFEVDVGATDYEFKQKIAHVNIILEPMKVIERIELNLFVK